MEALGRFVLFCLYAAFNTVVRGWALSTLWGWFVVQKFNAPPLGILEAFGICLVAQVVAGTEGRNEGEKPDTAYNIAVSILLPLLAVIVGWIIKSIM